jgi:uncharacterized protein with gpF-like domain
MATEAEIRKHQKKLDELIKQFETGLQDQLDDAFDSVAALGTDASRTDVLQIFESVRAWADSETQKLNTVIESNIEMNATVLGSDVNQQTLSKLQDVRDQMQSQIRTAIDQEQNRVIETIVLAGVAGAVARDLISQTRSIKEGSERRVGTVFGNAVYQFDAIVTRARSPQDRVQRYQYVGGLIDSSREFCQTHDGAIYTEQEIRDIWNDTWPGQAPGDPFVVRGGYNCRHTWVAVEEE